MKLYYRLSENYNINKLVSIETNPYSLIDDYSVPYFTSCFLYNEEHKKQFDITHSLASINDVVTSKLWWDFDSKDLNLALTESRTLYNRLQALGATKEHISVAFSGQKGVAVVLKTNEWFTRDQVWTICSELAKDLTTFDTKMYDAQRIFRLPLSKHEVTGLYKIPLSEQQFLEGTINDIKAQAERPEEQKQYNNKKIFTFPKNKIPAVEAKKVNSKHIITDIDWSKKPKWLSNCRFALQNGLFIEGERSNALLCLGSTYKNLGFDINQVEGYLNGVAEAQASRNDVERFPEKEIKTNVTMQLFADTWRNGQFTCREEGWLRNYCNSLGEKSCKHSKDNNPRIIVSLSDKFKDHAVNIEKNTIITGLATLDKNIPLTTGTNIGLLAPAGVGKCLGKDTPVIMYDGNVKMVQNVVVGDLLMGDDSTPRRVLSVCSGSEPLYRIDQQNGDSYVVNESHILSLKGSCNGGTKKYHYDRIHDVDVKSIISFNKEDRRYLKGYKVGVEFPSKTLLSPYLLGAWLGDGTETKPEITIHESETELRHFITKLCNKENIQYRENIFASRKSNIISGNLSLPKKGVKKGDKSKFAQFLVDFNLLGNKHIPFDYLSSCRSQRLELLAGLLDTDGYYIPKRGAYELTMSREGLIDQICWLVRSLGFRVQKYSKNTTWTYNGNKNKGKAFRLQITGNNLNEIPCVVPRKQAVKRNLSTYWDLTKIELVPIGVGDYYGFEIDGNKRFLLGDFTVTHNTSFLLNILNNTSKKNVPSVFASLDMHDTRIYEKILYKVSGMKRQQIYDLFKNNGEQALLDKVHKEFGNVYLFNKSCPSVQDLKEYILDCQEKRGEKIKLVAVDYFERIMSDFSDENQSSKRVAGELQDLVNDLDVALITLVQPNKSSLSGGIDKPIRDYTAIKGSSYLYQSFRVILSLTREFSGPNWKHMDKYLTVSTLKYDLGETDDFILGWNGAKGEVRDLDQTELNMFYEELSKKKEKDLHEKSVSNNSSW